MDFGSSFQDKGSSPFDPTGAKGPGRSSSVPALSTLGQETSPVAGPRTGNFNSVIPTPVRPDRLRAWLDGYNEKDKEILVRGFVGGFDVGYVGGISARDCKNLVSAFDLPHIVDKKIRKEVLKGRIAGPFQQPPFPDFHISPLGVVPKKDPGTYRLIHHLSHPKGVSVNDHIPDEVVKVRYQTIDTAIHLIKTAGKGAFLAKTDVSEAFRIMPVRPDQYNLFGMRWKGQFYFDKCLPMGCRSSCKIFECFSSALQWIAQQKLKVKHVSHVLDDFLFIDRSVAGCGRALDLFINLCQDLGVPIADDKTFAPSTVMTFLGYV